jgi:arsenate reductase
MTHFIGEIMILYIYHKCSTCQKALKFLQKNKIENLNIKEISETPPSLNELRTMLKYQNGNLKKLFNTSGQLYRELKLNEKLESMPLDDALKLLSQNGMLVKRPFLLDKDKGTTGFNENEWLKY